MGTYGSSEGAFRDYLLRLFLQRKETEKYASHLPFLRFCPIFSVLSRIAGLVHSISAQRRRFYLRSAL